MGEGGEGLPEKTTCIQFSPRPSLFGSTSGQLSHGCISYFKTNRRRKKTHPKANHQLRRLLGKKRVFTENGNLQPPTIISLNLLAICFFFYIYGNKSNYMSGLILQIILQRGPVLHQFYFPPYKSFVIGLPFLDASHESDSRCAYD